jgi:integrase
VISSPDEASAGRLPDRGLTPRVPPEWGSWSEQQLEQVLDVCRQDAWATSRGHHTLELERAAWWASFFATAWSTGARHGELLRLRVRDVDLAAGQIRLGTEASKMRREQRLPLCSVAIRELRGNLAFWRQSPRLAFPWSGHRATFCKQYRQILAAAGFPVARRARRRKAVITGTPCSSVG